MIKIYLCQESKYSIGGGFTFVSNLTKALKHKVAFVENWQDCDLMLMFSVTAIDKGKIYEALKAGKKLVLRVDNIPRKSRNKRQSPAERLREFGKLSDKVIYQSAWAERYAGYFAGKGKNGSEIIYNGVDTDIFNKDNRKSDGKTYLYANYNDNPNKRFDEALYWFDMAWREDNDSRLLIAGNVPKVYLENPEFNWDIPTNAKVEYAGIMNTPEEMANLYKRCDYLIYPSFAEACPNVMLEAMACGLQIVRISQTGGAKELYEHSTAFLGEGFVLVPDTIQQMGEKYLKVFKEVCQE